MAKPTPGPWEAHGEDFHRAEFTAPPLPNGANARLIAAAPDLLQALKLALAEVSDADDGESLNLRVTPKTLALMRSAVAKATGGAE